MMRKILLSPVRDDPAVEKCKCFIIIIIFFFLHTEIPFRWSLYASPPFLFLSPRCYFYCFCVGRIRDGPFFSLSLSLSFPSSLRWPNPKWTLCLTTNSSTTRASSSQGNEPENCTKQTVFVVLAAWCALFLLFLLRLLHGARTCFLITLKRLRFARAPERCLWKMARSRCCTCSACGSSSVCCSFFVSSTTTGELQLVIVMGKEESCFAAEEARFALLFIPENGEKSRRLGFVSVLSSCRFCVFLQKKIIIMFTAFFFFIFDCVGDGCAFFFSHTLIFFPPCLSFFFLILKSPVVVFFFFLSILHFGWKKKLNPRKIHKLIFRIGFCWI